MRRIVGLIFIVLLGCTQAPPERQVISTAEAPKAIGPYSQAIRVGNTVYVAGQIGLDPQTGALVSGGIGPETEQVLQNVQAILQAAGLSLADVVQSQVYLADLNDYAAMNQVYGRYLEREPPARAAVQVARLPRDARVEIMVTAVQGR